MLLNNKVVFSDDSVLSDLSSEFNDYRSSTATVQVIAAEDALYLGSDMPFNHRYIDVTTGNANASIVSVSIWDGSSFNDAVDVHDETSSAGATLAQSGIISWVTDRNKTWSREDTAENVTGLTSLKIYDMYWVKLTFSADTSATVLNYVGHKFAKNGDIATFYPDLARSDILTAYKAGKTDWDEQLIAASEVIIRDLRKKNIIFTSSQILGWEQFNEACIHKVAEIVFGAFGDDYDDNRLRARASYKESLEQGNWAIDRDADARLDVFERIHTVGISRG